MSTNYRSPAEVFDLASRGRAVGLSARRPAPGGPLDRAAAPARRRRPDGVAAAAADEVMRLLDEVEGTVGVIVPQPRLVALTEELAAAGTLRRTGSGWSARPGRRVWSTTRCW